MSKIVTALAVTLALVALCAARAFPEKDSKAARHHEGFNQNENVLFGMIEDFGEDEEHAAADVKVFEQQHPDVVEAWAAEDEKEAKMASKMARIAELSDKERGLVRVDEEMGATEDEALAKLAAIEKERPEIDFTGEPLTEIEEGLVKFEEEMGEEMGEALANMAEIEQAHPNVFADHDQIAY